MTTSASADELIESALLTAKEFAGFAPGVLVVITAGRQTGLPGATNLITVREIP